MDALCRLAQPSNKPSGSHGAKITVPILASDSDPCRDGARRIGLTY
jgi:hypothetical protein